jgi:hypothetical protein
MSSPPDEPTRPRTPLEEFSEKAAQLRYRKQMRPSPGKEGWICPRCLSSNAPWSDSCANPNCLETTSNK